ncbi:MAG: N-formylglutamate amidohydrolase [Sedimentisphaerales bacterium]|nr:N-formylglutamate amidohydrolase [Sedimentisphaerales bacterium]
MTLPILISVPHAGLSIPCEVQDICILTLEQICADSDEGAAEIYDLQSQVAAYLTSDVARAIVDLNRLVSDRRPDGVVKTHTCWSDPVYRSPLSELLIQSLLNKYYHPYHRQLTKIAKQSQIKIGLDCHTMAAVGPPLGPDPGEERPWVCLSNNDRTCPRFLLDNLAECFERTFKNQISINRPFRGGCIISSHADELPWIQIEISRAAFYSNAEKGSRILEAVTAFCKSI